MEGIGQKTLLLVEDEALIALETQAGLEDEGFRVLVAGDAEAALDLCRREPGIDLVLMDIALGAGLDGFGAAASILALRDLPIIYLSNHGEKEVLDRCGAMPTYGYIRKGSESGVIAASVGMALRLHETALRLALERENLRKSEELYRSLFENLLNCFAYCRMVYDATGRAVDFTYLAVNAAFEKQTGLRDVVGKRVTEVIPGFADLDSALLEIYGRAARSRVPERFEYRVESLDQWFLVSVYSPAEGDFVAIFDVITERKEAELERERLVRELLHLSAEMDAVFDLAPFLLSLHDAGGRYLRANRALQELFGFDPTLSGREETARRLQARFADGHHLEAGNMPSSRVLRGERVTGVEYLVTDAQGRAHNLVFNGFPLVVEGRYEGAVFAQADVTAYRGIETKLQRLVAEKEVILREAHHRIKNSMATLGAIITLQAGAAEDPKVAAALEEAAGRVESMQVLYQRIFQEADFESLSAREFLPSLVQHILGNLPLRDSIQVDMAFDEITLGTRQLQPLALIVNELVTNAMKHAFMARGGGRLELRLGSKDGACLLLVADDGPGFAPGADNGRLPGFGISLVKTLVQQLGGTLRLGQGPGARVEISFPV